MASMMLTFSWLKFIDMPLFTMCMAMWPYIYRHLVYSTILAWAHHSAAQGLDPS